MLRWGCYVLTEAMPSPNAFFGQIYDLYLIINYSFLGKQKGHDYFRDFLGI